MTKGEIVKFQRAIYDYYYARNRDFPWRHTSDPYRIVVSEIMLQQTQAERTVPKYKEFIKKFPSFRALAAAPTRDVLAAWQGLGYNRRAVSLQKLAQIVVTQYKGKLPRSREELLDLPGIGPGTAGSIRAFAFNEPDVFIETNIRTVYIHFFFKNSTSVDDIKLFPRIEQTLGKQNPRQWYWALMDYGVMLKKQFKNPSRRSTHYVRQSVFKGSNRELRGAILREVLAHRTITLSQLAKNLEKQKTLTAKIVAQLAKEGFITITNKTITVK